MFCSKGKNLPPSWSPHYTQAKCLLKEVSRSSKSKMEGWCHLLRNKLSQMTHPQKTSQVEALFFTASE